MIVVTGATGELGSRIIDRLLTHTDASLIGVSVRDVGKASALVAKGVRVRAADFTQPSTLAYAFEGADTVLVVSAAIRGSGATDANCAAIDAAREAGASRILYTSHQAASHTSHFPPARVHAATEDHLAGAGVPYTALRHGFYATALTHLLAGSLAEGAIYAPADGPVSWTAHDDLAEADAATLVRTAPRGDAWALNGKTAPLATSESFDLAGIAGLLSEIAGRPIERVVVEDDVWLATAVERGMPEAAALFTLDQFIAARSREFEAQQPILDEVLGRKATSVRVFLERLALSS